MLCYRCCQCDWTMHMSDEEPKACYKLLRPSWYYFISTFIYTHTCIQTYTLYQCQLTIIFFPALGCSESVTFSETSVYINTLTCQYGFRGYLTIDCIDSGWSPCNLLVLTLSLTTQISTSTTYIHSRSLIYNQRRF